MVFSLLLINNVEKVCSLDFYGISVITRKVTEHVKRHMKGKHCGLQERREYIPS